MPLIFPASRWDIWEAQAVHGDHASHARYRKLDTPDADTGIILHLSPAEHKLVIDSLIQRRELLKEDFSQTEQLLRRATGGILEYINEIGERPLKISPYDQAVLGIHEGNYEAFEQGFRETPIEQEGALLIHVAGRPGMTGRRMVQYLLAESVGISNEEYLAASHKAVDTGERDRVSLMLQSAEHTLRDIDMSLYGEVIRHAYIEKKRHMSSALIGQCSPEQIAAAHPVLLYIAAMSGDYQTMSALVEKGLKGGEHTGRIVHTLTHSNNGWMLEGLIEKGFQVEASQIAQTKNEPEMGGV